MDRIRGTIIERPEDRIRREPEPKSEVINGRLHVNGVPIPISMDEAREAKMNRGAIAEAALHVSDIEKNGAEESAEPTK